MARSAEKRSDDPADAGQRRTGARLALAAGIVALALSPLVAYLAASFDGAREPGSPAVWSVPGVALVLLYALVAPAGAFTAWGTAGSGRLPIAGAAVAAGADLAALAVLLAVRADEFVWGPGLLVFFALFLLPGALAALAVAPLRRAGP